MAYYIKLYIYVKPIVRNHVRNLEIRQVKNSGLGSERVIITIYSVLFARAVCKPVLMLFNENKFIISSIYTMTKYL